MKKKLKPKTFKVDDPYHMFSMLAVEYVIKEEMKSIMRHAKKDMQAPESFTSIFAMEEPEKMYEAARTIHNYFSAPQEDI